MRKQLKIFIVLMLTPILFIGSFDVVIGQSEAHSLLYFSGNNQTGMPGKPLPISFIVKVVDVDGNPVQNFPVIFSIYLGEGRLNGEYDSLTVLTDAGGFAQVKLTLGAKQYYTNQVMAAAAGLVGSPVIFTAISKSAKLFDNALHLNGNHQYFEIPAAP
ncbi:MAG: Ig-like domain-containing protein, partial [Calditrichales bacterium]|nr:Ig-like domain-containing protein [Calditrichales bacterium]